MGHFRGLEILLDCLCPFCHSTQYSVSLFAQLFVDVINTPTVLAPNINVVYSSDVDRVSWNLETENYDCELSRQSFPFQPLPQLARPPVVWPGKILLNLGSQLILGERGQL